MYHRKPRMVNLNTASTISCAIMAAIKTAVDEIPLLKKVARKIPRIGP
jgi:hypothetical protein